MKRILLSAAALTTFAAFSCTSPVSAAPSDLDSMDCSQGAAMMMSMPDHAMMPSPSPAMTTDQAFTGMMGPMMHHAAMMAGMELKCGKDPDSRAHAAKLLQQLDDDGVTEANDILHTYNH